MEARTGEEHGALLAQPRLSLTRGCCCCLLGPEFCLPGAAGEGAGTGTGSACPGFRVVPKLPSVGSSWLRAAGAWGLFLGDVWVSLWLFWERFPSSGIGQSPALTDHPPQALPLPLWCRSHLAPQGEMFTSHHTKTKTLNERLFHRRNLFSNLKTALLEKSRSAGSQDQLFHNRSRRRNFQPGQSSSGTVRMCFVLAPPV